jgi:hypothetical protein
VKRFENRTIVVQLGEWRIQCHQETVVDAGMADIMTNGRDEKRQGLKRPKKLCDWRLVTSRGQHAIGRTIRW